MDLVVGASPNKKSIPMTKAPISLVNGATGNTLNKGTHSQGQGTWMDWQRVLPFQQPGADISPDTAVTTALRPGITSTNPAFQRHHLCSINLAL